MKLLLPMLALLGFAAGFGLARKISHTPVQAPAPVAVVAAQKSAPAPVETDALWGLAELLKSKNKGPAATVAARMERAAEQDFAAALALAHEHLDKQPELLGCVLAVLARTEPERAWQMLLGAKLNNAAVRAFFHRWARVNRAAAIHFADTHPEIDPLYISGTTFLDMEGLPLGTALSAVAAAQRPHFRQLLVAALGKQWPKNDLAGWLAFQDALPEVPRSNYYSRFHAGEMLSLGLQQNVANTLAVVAALRSPWVRDEAWRAVASELVKKPGTNNLTALLNGAHGASLGPALAEQLGTSGSGGLLPGEQDRLIAQLPAGTVRTRIISALAAQAAAHHAHARSESLLNLLPAAEGGEAYAKLARQWAQDAPAQASGWLATLPAGSVERDWALAGTTTHLWLSQGREAALRAVDSITVPEARLRAIHGIAAVWRSRNPAACRAWLSRRSELSPVQQMELADPATPIILEDL